MPGPSNAFAHDDWLDASIYGISIHKTWFDESTPIRPKERNMEVEDIGYAIDSRIRSIVRTEIRGALDSMKPPPLTIDALKKLLADNPQVMLALVMEVCSSSEWIAGQIDNYFSQDPTPLFKEAVKEALTD